MDKQEAVMKYSDLRKVLAIYEEQSFTAAARRLYISQPADRIMMRPASVYACVPLPPV